jgi:hypothetical protein
VVVEECKKYNFFKFSFCLGLIRHIFREEMDIPKPVPELEPEPEPK